MTINEAMRKVLLLLVICLSSLGKTKYTYPKSKSELMSQDYTTEYLSNKKILEHLGQVKLEIIRGNLSKAKLLLLQAKYTNNFSKVIQFRYLALTQFLDEEYSKVIETLNVPEFSFNSNYEKVCSLKTLSYLLLKNRVKAKKEWKKCFKQTYFKSDTVAIWLDSFVVSDNFKKIKITESFKRADSDTLKMIFKLALYLGEEKTILKYIRLINYEAISNDEIREILAFMYYRQKELINASEFLKGINTANTANIKGNIYLLQDKKEKAYAQFKLAFKMKSTSQNSIKRLVPLSWYFRQFNDGLKFSFYLDDQTEFLKLLQSAFLTQDKKYEASNKLLKIELKQRTNTIPLEMNLLLALNHIFLEDNINASKFSESSCLQKDGLSCLFQYHFSTWDDFSKFIKTSHPIKRSDIIKRYIASSVQEPIDEEVVISQRNIEELDLKEKNI